MQTQKVIIDVKKLAVQTNNGKEIYKLIFPEIVEIDEEHFENVFNPFYKDKNPSLSIYRGNGMWWRHHDHGNSIYSGDAIDIAAEHYNLDRKLEFAKLLFKIASDLKLSMEDLTIETDNRVFESIGGYVLNGDYRNDEEGLDEAFNYFRIFGISKKVLKRYGVRSVKHLWTIDNEGKPRIEKFKKNKLVFAYENVNHTKLYMPTEEKQFKFRYIGNKPKDFVFGLNEICNNIHKLKKPVEQGSRGPLIITGGEKDVLTLASKGYDAICLNSETAKFPKSELTNFLDIYNKVIVLYDIDKTGKKHALELAKEHGFSICTLPDELAIKGGKDVSDYFKFEMSEEVFHQMILDSKEYNVNNGIEFQETQILNNETEPINNEMQSVNLATPLFPDEVYTLLPSILQGICAEFSDNRDRDVCLISSLGVLSSCFPKVKGSYAGDTIGCNFNLFISAGASAGKGIMKWSRKLAQPINKHLIESYKKEFSSYLQKKIDYTKDCKETKGGPCFDEPIEPKQQRLFIPANSSSSSVYEYLDSNQTFGIIFDSEGDTLSSTMKNDWADFSTLIRKAFHHEHASMARRTNKEHLELDSPHLSIILSGTRNQIKNLMDSVENGLFSRFLFYDFEMQHEWKDLFGDGENHLKNLFEKTGDTFLKFWKNGENSTDSYFLLDESQRIFVKEYFEGRMNKMVGLYGDNIVGNVRRACICFYRIAMLLSAIHNMSIMNLHTSKLHKKMIIDNRHFRCAFLIIDTLMTHLELVYSRLERTASTLKLNFKQRSLFDALPKSFEWSEFTAIASDLGIGNDTAQKYRRDFIKMKLIENFEHNKYRTL